MLRLQNCILEKSPSGWTEIHELWIFGYMILRYSTLSLIERNVKFTAVVKMFYYFKYVPRRIFPPSKTYHFFVFLLDTHKS